MEKINSKVATMAQEMKDLKDRNTCEHKVIFKGLETMNQKQDEIEKKIQEGFDKIRIDAENRREEYNNKFANQDDLRDTKLELEKLKNKMLLAIGAGSVIWWIISNFNIKFSI